MPKIVNDKLSQFVSLALSHVDEHGDWAWATSPLARPYPWCAAFVRSCAKTIGGLDGVIMATSDSCTYFASTSTQNGFGEWLIGPTLGQHPVPYVGDLIFFRWNNPIRETVYHADHIGIVCEVYDDCVITVEGNTRTGNANTSYVSKKSYNINATTISGYFRPNWARVGANQKSQPGNHHGKLFGGFEGVLTNVTTNPAVPEPEPEDQEDPSTRHDAMMREVAYLSSSIQPSIKPSEMRLSVINYTSSLSSLLNVSKLVSTYNLSNDVVITKSSDIPQQSISYSLAPNISGFSSNETITIKHLMSKGIPASSACGLCGNIYWESNFNPGALGDRVNGVPTSYGIVQWHDAKVTAYLGTQMKNWVGPTWASNLSGQIEFLLYHLQTGEFQHIYNRMLSAPNTVDGARQIADYFVRNYERPPDIDNESAKRQNKAAEYFVRLANQITTR